MDTVLYMILASAYLILFIMGILMAKKFRWMDIGNVLLLVILALFYDNGILAFGKYIGEGGVLKGLNEARYWLHALITPLLILFAWKTLVNANLQWAKKKIIQWLVVIYMLSLMIIELVTVVWDISLKPTWDYGVLSYEKTADGSPLMIMGVSASLLITSLILWWKQKWPWYFLGILFMGITPLTHFFIKTNAIHNLGELGLMTALLATKAYQDRVIHEK
ncbi:hypothetical protein R4Z10_07470 [Niallia sp. XMNu-256]|uniref:hypothetical protein n=1 Tax=Niallia sp. XMNu-256 TaxID=3082444 RepID=UPI0030D04F50